MKVLVIDDDPIVVEAVQHSLEAMGHDVSTRSSALGASACILREQPEVVLVDLKMPGLAGDDWLEMLTADQLAPEGGQAPAFVVFSSSEIEALERVVRDTCAVGYIPKQNGIDGFAVAFDEIVRGLV